MELALSKTLYMCVSARGYVYRTLEVFRLFTSYFKSKQLIMSFIISTVAK